MSRILYVEDEALLQLDGEACLTAAGYDVVVAGDGEEARDYLRGHGAGVDVLITDIDLPGALKGWRIAELGREASAALAVVYVTGAAALDFKRMAVPRGVLFAKPFAWTDLIRCLPRVSLA